MREALAAIVVTVSFCLFGVCVFTCHALRWHQRICREIQEASGDE